MFNFFKKKECDTKEQKVVRSEDFNDISIISKYFHNETGITFDNQISILQNKVILFCRQREIFSFSDLLAKVNIDETLKQDLIDQLTTNETFFNREFKQIEELVSLVKKEVSKVDILCAPSSTGEESYSIAIALLEAGVPSTDFHIIGIDINADAIRKANHAVYKDRTLRKLSPQVISKYFTKEDSSYILDENIKRLVSFKVSNIFDNDFKFLGKFDFIFSRNMLIYFDKDTKKKAKRLLESMRKNDKHNIFFGHADCF